MMVNKYTAKIIRQGLANGYSPERIAEHTGVPVDQIKDYEEKPKARAKPKQDIDS